jgi:hypothetical protein
VFPDLAGSTTVSNSPVLLVNDDWVEFDYSTSDGGFALNCTHGRAHKELNDYLVICGKGTANVKEYLVHLIIRRYIQHLTKNITYEVMYWVNDRNGTQSQFSSITQYFTFMPDSSPAKRFSMSLGVENDAAMLRVSTEFPD